MFQFVSSLVVVLTLSHALQFPSYITPCKEEEVATCFLDAANTAIKGFLPGDERYGIPSFFPLELGNIEINERQMRFQMKNCQLHGFETMHFFDIAWKSPVGKAGFTIDNFSLTGEFASGGKLYDINFPRGGFANFSLNNVVAYFDVIYKSNQIPDNKHQLGTFKQTFDINPATTIFSFSELGSGVPFATVENDKEVNKIILQKFESALIYAFLNSGARIVTMFPLESLYSD